MDRPVKEEPLTKPCEREHWPCTFVLEQNSGFIYHILDPATTDGRTRCGRYNVRSLLGTGSEYGTVLYLERKTRRLRLRNIESFAINRSFSNSKPR